MKDGLKHTVSQKLCKYLELKWNDQESRELLDHPMFSLTHLAPDRPALSPYSMTPDHPVAAAQY